MPAKPPIKRISAQDKALVDLEYRKAETQEKIYRTQYDAETLIVKKLEILAEILGTSVACESTTIGEVSFHPVIEDDWDKKVIKNKIIELVKKL